jgi:biopolymer transport protein ExbD
MIKPAINVTPLIDVLLVLLIIFMIITPTKPSKFETKIPQEPKDLTNVEPNILSLVVTLDNDMSLALNNEKDLGSVNDSDKLVAKLRETFQSRKENRVYSDQNAARNDLSEDEKTEKTVFIKAPKSISYGNVTKVIDAVKMSGAQPISLQIDGLK